MSQDLDEQCARVLGGWPPHQWIETWDGDLCWHCLKNEWEQGLSVRCESWSPSRNHDAARELEDEIERRGLQTPYVLALMDGFVRETGSSDGVHWHLVRATPEQRTRAFLAAVEGTTP